MPKYIKARQGPKNSVIYTDDSGSDWVFEGGFIPWRNQNPGDLRPGTVSRRNGSIGSANGFAVFPDYTSGHAALIDLLQNTYGNKDIPSLMKFYAPPKDRNKTKKYIKFIEKQTGVRGNKKIKNFTPEEFEKLWKAIEQMEGWGRKPGIIRLLDDKKAKILQVHISKNGIIDRYNISGYGWVSKEQGVALTQQGKVDAIVAISPHGHLFLRGRPGHAIS